MTIPRQELKAQLKAAASADYPFPDERFAGRGIVICAGGARLFTCAWAAIALLRRHLACRLPIEVWHLGPEEMGPPMRGLLEELGAQPVDAFEVAKRHQVERLGGWELKPYAVLHSRFREVLQLDADNVPVRDPAFLFDRPEFRDTGTLFWPDIVRLSQGNEIWPISGLDYRDTPSVESGQMILDKSRCWRALSLAHWINQHSNVFYQFLHGDKDTYLIAWLMLTQPYHLMRHRPKLLEATLCQRDPEGAVLFQHRNGAKWILDGNNPRIDGFRLERECRVLLAELATLWDGRLFNPPPRSDEARRLEGDLLRSREFRVVRVDGSPYPPDTLSRDWWRAVNALGLPRIMFHALRHSHASALIAPGLDILTVSRMLGHGSPAITLGIYAHSFNKTAAAAAQAIEVAMGKGAKPSA